MPGKQCGHGKAVSPIANQIWSPDTAWQCRGGQTTTCALPATPPGSVNQTGKEKHHKLMGPPCQADGAGGRGRDGTGDAVTYGVV